MSRYKAFLLAGIFMAGISSTSCNRGVGCPANENLRAPVNKKGEYKNKAAKSGLWSKKTSKKMKG